MSEIGTNQIIPGTTSAVVTCRNYGRYVKMCLDSLLAQTRPFDEIILIDDHSEDETREVWEHSFQGRVQYAYVRCGEQTLARHEGLKKSCGEFIVFVDADDWLDEIYHEKLIAPLLRDPAVGFAYCGQNLVHHGVDTDWFPAEQHTMRPFNPRRLWKCNYLGSSTLIRRRALPPMDKPLGFILENGTTYGEDWDMWMRMTHAGWKGVLIPQRLIHYRIHNVNTSRSVYRKDYDYEPLNWKIRSRYHSYDLCLFIPYTGEYASIEFVTDQIKKIVRPQRTQILFIDGSTRFDGKRKTLPWATHYLRLPKKPGEGSGKWLAKACCAARNFTRAEEILMLHENLRVRPDTYLRLHEGMKIKSADYYAARLLKRDFGRPVAWRAAQGDPEKGLYLTPVLRAARRVFASEFYCVLMTARGFHAIANNQNAWTTPYKSLFIETAAYASKNGWRWFVDGRVHFKHPRDRVNKHAHAYMSPARLADDRLPPVSIIIPVLNMAEFLPVLLKSVLSSDYPKHLYEIIVVDNGSSDGSDKIAEATPGVRLVRERKRSSYAARNRGIRESRYDLIAFIDADCEATPFWLKEMVAAIESAPDVGVVGGNSLPKRENRLSRLERSSGGYCNQPGSHKGHPPYVITMNVLYRRRVFEDAGFFNDSQISGSDVEMAWRVQRRTRWQVKLLKTGGTVFHHDILAARKMLKRHVRIGDGMYEFFQQHPFFTPAAFYWLPQKQWELLLQNFKKAALLFIRQTKALKFDLLEWYRVIRAFIHQSAYLRRSRIEECGIRRGSLGNRKLLLYVSNRELTPVSADFERLRSLDDSGFQILHMRRGKSVRSSWLSLFSSMAGLTHCWNWRRGLSSMDFWNLFPSVQGLDYLNLRINAARARHSFRLASKDSMLISGSVSLGEMDTWRKMLGSRALLVPPNFLGEFPDYPFPLTGCLVEKIDSSVDIEALSRIARMAECPVFICGKADPADLEDLAEKAWKNPHLYFILRDNPEQTFSRIAPLIKTALYFVGTHTKEPVIPAVVSEKAMKNLSFLTNRPYYRGAESFTDRHCSLSEAEAARWIRRAHLYPETNERHAVAALFSAHNPLNSESALPSSDPRPL